MVRRMKGKLKPKNTPLLIEGNLYYKKEEKARYLNEYFQSTMSKTSNVIYSEEQLEKIRTEKEEGGNPEYNSRFTMQEIENAKKNLKTNKAYGTDEINNSFLKNLPQAKTQELLGIFNRSWNSGKVPTLWKTGLIIPIAKPHKSPKLTESYRPITLLQCTSKLM